ncbi:Flp family type IVb pilin [Sagittula sp. S175]|uniref:Flp family type IVb pilin n=1 Tax=Sagittula sp. S175 TaxID=3415129 RepID=UPI003C79DCA5
MMNFLKNFRADESGAVTVDWVVLTAAVVGLAIAAYSTIRNQAFTLIENAAAVVGTESTTLTSIDTGIDRSLSTVTTGGNP